MTTGIEYRDARVRRELVLTSLLSVFGALALLMCCLGLHGTVTHAVTRRIREIGIRSALGARWPQIVHTILGRYGLALGAGIVRGLVAAVPLSGFVESLLFGVSRVDGWTLAGAVVVIVVAAGLASLRPAVRAARLNPVDALRVD